MNPTHIRASALVLLLLPTSAVAGINVRAELEVGSALPVVIVRGFDADHDDDASSATVVYEGGNRCEILLNADPVGPKSFVAINVRCTDPHGRTVLASQPNVLVKNGEVATVSVGREGDHPTTGVSVRILVTEDPSSAAAIAVRRDFFVQPGGKYAFYRMKPPWTSLSCVPGEFTVEGGDNMLVKFDGRYRAGDVLETDCTAVTDSGPVQVPVIVSLF